MIVPQSQAKEELINTDKGDHVDDGNSKRKQKTQLKVIKNNWILDKDAQEKYHYGPTLPTCHAVLDYSTSSPPMIVPCSGYVD